MVAEKDDVRKKIKFIRTMFDYLDERVNDSINSQWSGKCSYDRGYSIRNDIVRLRRELCELYKMFCWEYRK